MANVPTPKPEKASQQERAEPRRRALLSGLIVHSPSQLSVPCTILDISRRGARVRLAGLELLGDPLYLIDLNHGLAFKARTAWRDGVRLGLNFVLYFDLSKPDADRPPVLHRLWMSHISYGPSS